MALPPTLAEASCSATRRARSPAPTEKKPGKLEVAGRGTVLLDEVGDMDPALQGKLLRVLEERTFERVGGVKPIEMGARVISASHRDLGALVEEDKFRLDLYHRLSVFPITIAPLRARGEDVLRARRALHRRVRRAHGQEIARARRTRCASMLLALRLAGQRARAQERDRARGDPAVGRE